MQEGAVTLLVDGVILYRDRRFAEIVSSPLEGLLSQSIYHHFAPEDSQSPTVYSLYSVVQSPDSSYDDFDLQNQRSEPIPLHIAVNALQFSQFCMKMAKAGRNWSIKGHKVSNRENYDFLVF